MQSRDPFVELSGPPKCVHCGYDLRGRDQVTTCPECGKVNRIVENRILARDGSGYAFAAIVVGVIGFFAAMFSMMVGSHGGPALPMALVVGPAFVPALCHGGGSAGGSEIITFLVVCILTGVWHASCIIALLKAIDHRRDIRQRWVVVKLTGRTRSKNLGEERRVRWCIVVILALIHIGSATLLLCRA